MSKYGSNKNYYYYYYYYYYKILHCRILEPNSGPLDPKPDTLPVELSRRSTFIVHYIDNLTTARMSDNTRISKGKNFYFN